MIKIETLSKSFGKKNVLKNITVTLEKGGIYGIIGENGAGKTTLFRCIANLESYSGKISAALDPLKNHLGYLPTNPYFLSLITAREFLTLMCNARSISPKVIETYNVFELPLDQYASNFSTGMKKKLALTGILIQKNDFFILDEPFNGVDIQSNMLITEIIRKLRDLEKTVIISSHIFSTLKDTCDFIYPLTEGVLEAPVPKDSFDQLDEKMKSSIQENKLSGLDL